jgi:hypothetical protein
MYKLVTEAPPRLTVRGLVQIAPVDLVRRFGPPGRGSACRKITGTYHFHDHRRRSIQIYDWKATTLYDARTEAGTLSPTDFWGSDSLQDFSVASTAAVDLVGFYPVSTDGLIKAENSRSRRATLRRMRGLWNRSM